MAQALLYGAAFLVIFFTIFVQKWRKHKFEGRLPPGSMGVPLIGETLLYIGRHREPQIVPFIKKRIGKYGPIFRTHLFGYPCIVSAEADFNHFLHQQEGQYFDLWWPKSLTNVAGEQTLEPIHHPMFKYRSNLIRSVFGFESLRGSFLSQVNHFVSAHLKKWEASPSVDVKDATAAIIFHMVMKKMCSDLDEDSCESLRKDLRCVLPNAIALPMDIPGTIHHKCLQAKNRFIKTLHAIAEERRKNGCLNKKGDHHGDLLDEMMCQMEKEGSSMTLEYVLSFILSLTLASYEPTSSLATAAVMFLDEHPEVLENVVEENERILKKKQGINIDVTVDDYKSMSYTSQVVKETLRIANITNPVFKIVTRDVKYKGYTIPSGWIVMVCQEPIHLDPNLYQDPLLFQPSRWEAIQEGDVSSKNFLPFGKGSRACPGAEFVRLFMATFIHHLVGKYRWVKVKGEFERKNGILFPDGYHVQLKGKEL